MLAAARILLPACFAAALAAQLAPPGTVNLVIARHVNAVSFQQQDLVAILREATLIICRQRQRNFPAEVRCPLRIGFERFDANERPNLNAFSVPKNSLLLPKSAVTELFRLDDGFDFRKVWVVRRISGCPGETPAGAPPTDDTLEPRGCAEPGGNTIVMAFDPEVILSGSAQFMAMNHRFWVHRQARRLAHELGHLARLPDIFPGPNPAAAAAAAIRSRLMYYSEEHVGVRLEPGESRSLETLLQPPAH